MCNLFKALKSISLQIINLIHQLNQRVLGILGVRLPQEHRLETKFIHTGELMGH